MKLAIELDKEYKGELPLSDFISIEPAFDVS